MVPLFALASRIRRLGMEMGLWSRQRPISVRMVRSEGLPNLTPSTVTIPWPGASHPLLTLTPFRCFAVLFCFRLPPGFESIPRYPT